MAFTFDPRRLLLILALSMACLAAAGCRDTDEPAPPLSPTPPPTPTPAPQAALEGSRFTISLDGELVATEEIRVGEADGQMIVFSEVRYLAHPLVTERRTVILSPIMNPMRYDLEVATMGVRSAWVAEREGEAMHVLSNNLLWPAPVMVMGRSPAPQIMLESAPSALPYALLALRYTQEYGAEDTGELAMHTLDVLEDYPVSRPITITYSAEREGAVIGTLALDGQIEGGLNPAFTMWARPGSRTLHSVEVAGYRPGLWPASTLPDTGATAHPPQRLLIQRVSALPEAPSVPEPASGTMALTHTGADGTRRAGTLTLPSGAGPFPCVVWHSPSGLSPRVTPGDTFASRGWAVYSYDARGLGESGGDHDRGPIGALAADAAAAAEMLRQRPEIDPDRIVYLGVGQAGAVGAVALTLTDAYAAAALACPGGPGSPLPALTDHRITRVLAPFYGWDEATTAAYRAASIEAWQQWLFRGEREVALLRRRASLQAVRDLADTDLTAALAESDAPVLILQGSEDAWTSPESARALVQQLPAARAGSVTLRMLDGVDHHLADPAGQRPLAPDALAALFQWLAGLPARSPAGE